MINNAVQSMAQNTMTSTNPARNFETIGEIQISSEAEIKQAVEKSHVAQKSWNEMGLEKRVQYLNDLCDHIEKHKDEFVKRTSQEMGMPNGLSNDIMDGFLSDMRWNNDNASKYLANEIIHEDDNEINAIFYEPYGVMAVIAAWNYPFGNFVASCSQALLAGNTIVMKYSEEIPLFQHYLDEIIQSSNLPNDVVQFVYGDGQVGQTLIDQDIQFVSFTGSSATGQKIYEQGAAKLIPVSLELGGSSPGIVFEDCPITDKLIDSLFWERFLNSAQFCNGMKRLFVQRSIFDDVVEKLSTYAKTKKIGDPQDEQTELGPLVAERQVVKLEAQVKDAIDKGAKLHCGGKRPDELQGAYYEPTILTNITKDMAVWHEEVFGPALPILPFDTYEEAINLANETEYGLSAIIFTTDKNIAEKALVDLQAGTVNQWPSHTYRPQNPFGGYKKSGIGRVSGVTGFKEITQAKAVSWIK
jgi:acyl-CoA reductase-like NAD-dependent aldehyde dehydrogenase